MSGPGQKEQSRETAILLISCPDAIGIDAAVTNFLSSHRGNIVDFDQHVDKEQNIFFLRVEWEMEGFSLSKEKTEAEIAVLAKPFNMSWSLRYSSAVPRMAVFVSKQPHCLYDLLARVQSGEWRVEIPLIISNHQDMEPLARRAGIPFFHIPVSRETREAAEPRQIALLKENRVDFIVLARYMQILTPQIIAEFPGRIINIHHSFLPAFPGAKPYHSAHARGVKIIGATSHYVTEDLDAGPIIEQDVIRVSHKDSVDDLVRRGRDLEKIVLSRAVWRHLQSKILVYSNKTVVFG
ncbi:MAG TPA: formyltetrahydrofolate deformylase [Kiritimatiellia bacterium]|nr:formyltetrahydrofolate deformylase [Kiritimatiellia bacterium]HPA77829.1 formyltetrahydrofolate deformylase [Kiritimatiellia bacterium]HQQ04486.1 formyltetrahydrofolate deformylase [Kiritimatiellia bacterium]